MVFGVSFQLPLEKIQRAFGLGWKWSCVFKLFFFFLFFWFLRVNSKITWFYCIGKKTLITHCLCTVHALFTGLTILFTHLKIILLQCFQFSVLSTISSIQTDPQLLSKLRFLSNYDWKKTKVSNNKDWVKQFWSIKKFCGTHLINSFKLN